MKPFMFVLAAVRTLGVILFAGLLAACASAAPAASGPVKLKVAVLPVLDALPLYVAQQEKLFEANQVQVELIPVASGPERDQLIAAGQADGMINETVSVLSMNKDEVRVQVVRYARAAAPGAPLFTIVSAKDSGIAAPADLKNQPVAISDGTVIAYLTDRLLAAEGFAPGEIQTVSVPKIPDRLALLKTGELAAGVLPEPAASMAVLDGGARVLEDSAHPEFSYSTLSFRKEVLDAQPEAVRNFLKAVEEATARINQDPNAWKPLLLEQSLLPKPLAESFQVPSFVAAGVPSEEQYADALAWATEKGMVSRAIPYADIINASFLPEK